MKHAFFIFIILSLISGACRENEKTAPLPEPGYTTDSTTGIAVADTIIYEVDIINRNPEDTWAEECLRGLDHRLLVDNIFKMIYEEKAVAYNNETGEKLTPNQVKKIEAEEGFNREKIAMIQFREAWYLNPGETEMTKKVLSMVLGIGVYGSNGEFRGNKAVFRVEL